MDFLLLPALTLTRLAASLPLGARHHSQVEPLYTWRNRHDPQLQRHVHRSQNRLESSQQWRSVSAPVGGKKALTGRTDSDSASRHQGAWLSAKAVSDNAAMLSGRLTQYAVSGQAKALSSIKPIALAAGRHSQRQGH